jgi:transmembrane sensor
MEIPNDIDWSLIAKYLAGEASPAETEVVERWAASDPAHASELEALRGGRRPDTKRPEDPAPTRVPHFDVDAAFAKSPVGRARAERAERAAAEARAKSAPARRSAPRVPRLGVEAPSSAPPSRARRVVAALAFAGVAAVLVVVAPIAWHAFQERQALLAQRPTDDDKIYETHKGERSHIELADGTTIAMAADTKLRVSSRYGDARRDVFLTGEALFDVVHDPAKPFAVHVGDLVAQDLGTEFGVRAYAGKKLQIVVAKGAVSLGVDKSRPHAEQLPALKPITLSPGDLGQLDSTGQIQLEHNVDVTRYLGWSQGRLQYQLAPLDEIIADLDRWYDVDIQLADSSLNSTRVTMSVTGKSVDDVMTVLAAALALHVERKGRVIRMY